MQWNWSVWGARLMSGRFWQMDNVSCYIICCKFALSSFSICHGKKSMHRRLLRLTLTMCCIHSHKCSCMMSNSCLLKNRVLLAVGEMRAYYVVTNPMVSARHCQQLPLLYHVMGIYLDCSNQSWVSAHDHLPDVGNLHLYKWCCGMVEARNIHWQ